ncbi:hypothetical protein FRB95_005254 [Tulasnella sp. JGI-2019a]|nr:hypothetical protein FRB95_005254 [Tulasnella sp. JGI-2019a]
MGGTIKTIVTLLFAFACGISAQQDDIVTVLVNSTQLIVSQNGIPLSQSYLYSQPYAGYYPQSCGGVLKLNSTVDTAATLIFVGTAIKIVYVLFPTGGNGMVYLDGQYQGDIDSYSVDASCTTSISSLSNLAPKSHNVTIVNKDVQTGTAIYSLAWVILWCFVGIILPSITPSYEFSYTPYTPSAAKVSKGPIIGGAVAGILILVLLLILVLKRRPRQRQSNRSTTSFDSPVPTSADFNVAPPVTYRQEPEGEGYAPHNPPSFPYAGYAPTFPNPTPAPPSPFDSRDMANDQRRVSIRSSSSPISHAYHSGSPPGAPPVALPIVQYSDQIQQQQQQQQYQPESLVSRPASNASPVDLVQQLVHTEVIRVMGEVAAASSSGGGGGVDGPPPPRYDEK